jgi:glycerol-3-phosphate dehydrogenase
MQRNPAALKDETFDLLILGGGITGAGVALDAVMRGLRVALIDKGDFASGTSSVSSKLVHGGLRYLEHGDLRLVYEALHERGLLLENAPHLVRPLRFVIPYDRNARVLPWKWRLGLTLYDLLAGSSNPHRSRPIPGKKLRHEFPTLVNADAAGGVEYADAQMDDARLCLEVLKTAAGRGALVANYVEAIAFEKHGEAISGVRALDRVGGGDFSIRARQVLNATGPWVDGICRLAGDMTEPRLRPTKGVHIIAPGRGLTAAFLLLHPRDGRVLFVIPWMGKTLIGTTDTFGDEPPEHLSVLPEEIDYLLQAHNHYFALALQPGDLLGSFAGLRPLLRARKNDPSALTREFRTFRSPGGLLSVAGGKYTTYRAMAEYITNRIVRRLNRRRRCRTVHLPLDGTPEEPWERFLSRETSRLALLHGLPEASARHLVERYGRRGGDVAEYLKSEPALARPVVENEPDLQVEFAYQRAEEMALYPADFLLRRTRLGLFRSELLEGARARS